MNDPDRLAEIKAREFGPTHADADWLVNEVERCQRDYDDLQAGFAGKVAEIDQHWRPTVERLRELLARLE